MEKYDVITMTFHQSENYGALLQAYALQTVIKSLGYSTCILNYNSKGVGYWSHKVSIRTDGLKLSSLKQIIWQKMIEKKTENFNKFRNYLAVTDLYTDLTIVNANELSDCFLVGSDQVWNCDCTFEDYHYFLDFISGDKRRVSYAASFGYSQIPNRYSERCKALLQRFNHITVREKSGKRIVKDNLNLSADVVLDPVLLMKDDDWNFKVGKLPERQYIFVYQAEKSKSLIQFAKLLSKKSGMPIYIVSNVIRGTFGIGIHSISDAGPDVFLEYLKNASYVVTNSFHGTALSILFNKEFYTELLKKNNTNSRVKSLLSHYGLNDRIIESGKNILKGKIDYKKVNNCLTKDRINSIAILDAMIMGRI